MVWEFEEARLPEADQALNKDLAQILGYLNFSSGSSDPATLACLNRVYERILQVDGASPTWPLAAGLLVRRLDELHAASESHVEPSAFRDADQARQVLQLTFGHVLSGYREFHQDLLSHADEQLLFGPFFVGRVFEAVLQEGPPWIETDRVVGQAIRRLNDYVGHRPVATLETHKGEPYAAEWVRPIPVYIKDAGFAVTPYRDVIESALNLIRQTDEGLLRAACFDPELLDELAIDPRAYDFDHPVHKRQNYHFGQWDPHHIDNQGRYRRFVIHQVTLDALYCRTQAKSDLPADQLLLEAGAVLAGTILMASGISGSGPDTHASTVTLATLLPRIAAYRDEFYKQLLDRLEGPHAERLQAESQRRRQPFGAARQQLNAKLARRRACQLEHVHLARMYARMGRYDASCEESVVVPSTSARLLCQIECWLTEGHAHVAAGRLDEAAELLPRSMSMLERAIACGAVVDPWNILGYDAQFSLFPSAENSVPDHRVEELIAVMDQMFGLYAEVWREAAANDNHRLFERIQEEFRQTVDWWRKYAVHEVASVDCPDPLATYGAAEKVAHALNLWQQGEASAGDVRFWAPHADMFDSPKAYALVIDALLDRGDLVASRALLVHWLGQVDRVPLEEGPTSFCRLAQHWFLALRKIQADEPDRLDGRPPWRMLRRFFDFLEANADQYWHAPSFMLDSHGSTPRSERLAGIETDEEEDDDDDNEDDDDDDNDGLYDAAYQDVVYRDSTDDGMDGAVFEEDLTSDDALVRESQRLSIRLAFLETVARLWRLMAVCPEMLDGRHEDEPPDEDLLGERIGDMCRWIEQALENQDGLLRLLRAVHEHRIPVIATDHESMVEYDRRRMIKESILERIMATLVVTADAARWLQAAAAAAVPDAGSPDAGTLLPRPDNESPDERALVRTFRDLLRGDIESFRGGWDELREALSSRPLLYVPLAKGGDPDAVVATRSRQQAIHDLLNWLPRLGLLFESCQLIETARRMERHNAVGPGAVTDFDALFKTGYRSIVKSLVVVSRAWDADADDQTRQTTLIQCLDQVSESLLASWLSHSRTLRLSVLERLNDRRIWRAIVPFVQEYGEDLFSQRFLNLGNLRAILHQGTDAWLQRQEERFTEDDAPRLLRALDDKLPRSEAVDMLTLILEAVAENYGEYRDYNSTTTQSDRGEMLYTLLDFLRLRTRYDRVCWNLKPYVMAHEVLVRQEETEAANIWREVVTERVNDEAEQYLVRLGEMQQKHAMQMPTVADRLAERFVRPMTIDRMRALVEPSLESDEAFEELRREVDRLTLEPTGVGLDVPAWLLALEDEVEATGRGPLDRDLDKTIQPRVPQVHMDLEEVRRQMDAWSEEL